MVHERDIEDLQVISAKFDGIIRDDTYRKEETDFSGYKPMLERLLVCESSSDVLALKRKHGVAHIKNSTLLQCARNHGMPAESLMKLTDLLRIKRGKSHSGVLVVTVFTSDKPSYTDSETQQTITQRFSCKWNCYYCPNEPGQPRSYLKGEPGVLRANRHGFDVCSQMWGRMDDLMKIGHAVDKLEVLVLGGTWASYPLQYRGEFVRDIYFAANSYYDRQRERGSLQNEKKWNQDATVKVIGLTLETRPDTIDVDEIQRLREYGCTRVQLGVQHVCDSVLVKINRRCTTEQVKRALQLLYDYGYKIDAHWMPNLPGSSPELDRSMFLDTLLKQTQPSKQIALPPALNGIADDITRWEVYDLAEPSLQFDQWKIYPCAVVPWTVIEKWYKAGSYVPYDETLLREVLIDTKSAIFPWIRLNRVIRDIPTDYIMASGDTSNMRQSILEEMESRGLKCRCIRCREVKLQALFDRNKPYDILVRQYEASGGIEYFISAEINDACLLGFCRLRIPSEDRLFENVAWIRELHVYGMLQETWKKGAGNGIQHKGIGTRLMRLAESIAQTYHNRTTMAVIAGEGTKGYYSGKLGYEENAFGYMTRDLTKKYIQ
jgi:histone acetyltransferase (RNA polymerase elongator complex component)